MMVGDIGKRYFIYNGITDMRKGIYGLSGLVRNELKEDPRSGDMFIFFGRNRCIVKMIYWDTDGYVMYLKKLEKGTFEKIKHHKDKRITIRYHELVMLLSGVTLSSVKMRPRYSYDRAV